MKIDTSTVEVLALSDGAVSRAYSYDTDSKQKTDRVDKDSGLPVWQIRAELFDKEDGKALFLGNLKVISADEPKITPRTVYSINGSLHAVAYSSADGRAAVSYSVKGDLQPIHGKKVAPAPIG